jgi:hypothetical protein
MTLIQFFGLIVPAISLILSLFGFTFHIPLIVIMAIILMATMSYVMKTLVIAYAQTLSESEISDTFTGFRRKLEFSILCDLMICVLAVVIYQQGFLFSAGILAASMIFTMTKHFLLYMEIKI